MYSEIRTDVFFTLFFFFLYLFSFCHLFLDSILYWRGFWPSKSGGRGKCLSKSGGWGWAAAPFAPPPLNTHLIWNTVDSIFNKVIFQFEKLKKEKFVFGVWGFKDLFSWMPFFFYLPRKVGIWGISGFFSKDKKHSSSGTKVITLGDLI